MTATPLMPAAFLGHGSPMNALDRNRYTEAWRAFGAAVPRPRAILAVSAHWHVDGLAVTAMPRPRTIHDFYGFPQALFDVQYPAPGLPALAEEVADAVSPDAVGADRDGWGLDHGTWGVLVHAFPDADIPVVQLSLDARKPLDWHLRLGAKLAALRARGVLVVGSGNVVHNLRATMRGAEDSPRGLTPWADAFDTRLAQAVDAGDARALLDYERLAPGALTAVPFPDHYFPFVYALGAAQPGEKARHVFTGFQAGTLSMRCIQWG